MLKLEHINKTYDLNSTSQVNALNDINYEFKSNGLYFISGKSGCGKTTLLNIIGTLDKPTCGTITILDKIVDFNDNDYITNYKNQLIGFIFQEYNLIKTLNVKDNVKLSLELQGKKVSDKEVEEVLSKVGIAELKNRKINELSGGQKQRVSIARAIIKNPRIIIADEPTGALDTKTSKQIFSLLKELSKEYLVIVVSHDEEYATTYADTIIKLEDGYIKEVIELNKREEINVTIPTLKANSIRFSTLIKNGFSSMKRGIIRLFFVILLAVIFLTFIAFTINVSLFNKNEYVIDGIKESNYEYTFNISGKGGEVIKEQLSSAIGHNVYPVVGGQINIGGRSIKTDDNYDDRSCTEDLVYDSPNNGLILSNENILSDLNYTMLAGTYPTSDGEIAITDYMYYCFLKYGISLDYNTYKEINGYDNILNQNFDFIYDLMSRGVKTNVTITGIINTSFDDSLYSSLIEVNRRHMSSEDKELYIEFQNKYLNSFTNKLYAAKNPYTMVIRGPETLYDGYITKVSTNNSNNMKLLNILPELSKPNNVLSDTSYYSLEIENATNRILDLKTLLIWVTGVSLVVTILFLFLYFNTAVANNKYNIGVLKSLGASKKDVLLYSSIEGILIIVISIVLAIILFVIGLNLLYDYILTFVYLSVNPFRFKFLSILSIVVVAAISYVLAMIIPFRKINKSNSIDIINNKVNI